MKEGGSDEEDIAIPNQDNYKGSQNEDSDDYESEEDDEEKSHRSAKNYVKPKIDLKQIHNAERVPTEMLTQMQTGDLEEFAESNAPNVEMSDANFEYYLEQTGITGYDIEMIELKDQEDMSKLKASLRLRFPVLMANIA